jgi:glucose-1-phosphate cytidylyltransferase
VLEIEESNSVSRFAEKPQVDGWASAGYFVFHRSIFDYLKDDKCVLELEPMERLAKEDQLMAFRHEGFFYAMDTYREFLHLNELWDSGEVPWKVW